MSNPFDQFDTVSKNPFDAFDTTEEKGNSILENITDTAKGAGEAALMLGTGAIGGIVGPLMGIQARVAGKSIQEAEAIAANQMQAMTYEPRTEKGKDYSDNVGKVVNELIPLAPLHGMFPAIKAGEAINAIKSSRDIPVPKAISPAESAIAALKQEASPKATITSDIPNLKSTEGFGKQLNLFDQFDETVGQKNQFQADPMNAVWRTDENGIPIRADLSMEAKNLEQPLQRNLFGDELGPGLEQGRSLTEAIDSMERTPIRDQGRFTGLDEKTEALKRLQGEIKAPADMQVAKMEADGYKIPSEASKPIDSFNTSTRGQGGGLLIGDSSKKLNFPALKEKFSSHDVTLREESFGVDKSAKSVFVELKDPNGNRIGFVDFAKRPDGILVAENAKVAPNSRGEGVAQRMYLAAREAGYDIAPGKVQTDLGSKMVESMQRTGLINAKAEGVRFKAGDLDLVPINGEKLPGDKYVPKSQRGVLKIDWSKTQEMKQISKVKSLRDAFPELTQAANTPEGIIEVAKNVPDIPDRGLVGKTIEQFTKGLLFENFKTNNPILKYTYQVVSDAVDASHVQIHKLITDTLTPTLRKLSNKEIGELGDVMVQAMKLKKDLSPEFLREHGFNEKQINAYETQKAIHKENFDTLNKARELAGKKPVTMYEGYIAGLASGNFRKVVYKTGEAGKLEVVGIVGSDFRKILDKRVEKLLKEHPEYSVSEKKFAGVKNLNTSKTALTEALTILSDNNPNFTEFAKALDDAMTSEGYDALGAKKHTMGKKGVFGMEGDKPWQTSYENAKDMFNAQIRYTETMAKWAEFSKAIDKLSVVFKDPEVQLKQPNALKMANDYVNHAMGQNPTDIGRGIDNLIGVTGNALGVGPNVLRQVVTASRNTVNTIFFALNHIWMAVNVLQSFLVMPEVKAFLRGRGIEVNLDVTGVSDNLLKGGYSSLKHVAGWNETPFEKSIWKYAKEHGIDQTNLIESFSGIRNGPQQMISRGLKFGANAVEAVPRAMIFSTLAQMLHDSGYAKDPALLDVARQLTDMSMTDYRPHEQIKAIQQLGMAGGMAANLTSFKQNTLSRYALFGRELGKGHSGAFTTALVAAVAYAGVMGLPGFTEMDATVEQLSKLMKTPTTLTKLVLDAASEHPGKMGNVLAMGTGAYYGVDLHNRIGMPSAMPSITGGFGKLADIATEAIDFAQKPNEWNAKQLARQMALPPLQPWMDLNWFSQTNPETGDNIALNKQGMGTVVRTKEDLMFKRLGFLGSNESKGKALDYATTQQDKFYADKQKLILASIQEVAAANKGEIPDAQMQGLINAYKKVQGNPDKFIKAVENSGVNLNTTARARRIISNQAGNVDNAYKLQRTRGE